VRAVRGAEVTGRVSYGRGIRAPSPTAAGAMRTASAVQLANPRLGPESQRGVEAGLEVRGGGASLQLTRYDQVAEGLVQRVPVPAPCAAAAGCPMSSEDLPVFQQQNVGVIANRGWEVQGALRAGAVGLWGTVALTDSRVRRLSPGYGGDLRAGDRPLGVARRAASATVALPTGPARLAVTAMHLGPRTDYDRHALRDAEGMPPGGTREFWRDYAPTTEWAASVALPLAPGRRVLFKVDDVFDRRAAARDVLGTTPGRTTMAALQLGF
jgi:outer membrane receptor protein involved in Fe transport